MQSGPTQPAFCELKLGGPMPGGPALPPLPYILVVLNLEQSMKELCKDYMQMNNSLFVAKTSKNLLERFGQL